MTQSFVIRENIRRFQDLLLTCVDEARRRTLEQLLSVEMKKLADRDPKYEEPPARDAGLKAEPAK